MSTLAKGVDPSISSPSTMNRCSLAGDTLEGAFQIVLNSVSMGLALPSGKWSAIVGNNQF